MQIVIDASAFVALYKQERDAEQFWAVLRGDEDLVCPVTTYLECVMVLRKHADARAWLDELVIRLRIHLFPCDALQIRLAADAFERFGHGSGHPAKLNFGDCLVYAAAASLGAPLLFKGEDFARTDVAPALA